MTEIAPELLELICCPQCGGDLRYTREKLLFCLSCRLCYPVEGGVPDLLPDSAIPLSPDGRPVVTSKSALFNVSTGGNSLVSHFKLAPGSSKAIGQRVAESVPGQVFNIDFTMTLDEHTKTLVSNYLAKKSEKPLKNSSIASMTTDIGPFKRLPDLMLDDVSVSRVHAMLFYDENGVGILDLVSQSGTFVNGKEVETAVLKPGDVLKIGSTEMKFSFK